MKPVIGITLDHESKDTYAPYPWYALREDYSNAVSVCGGSAILLPYNANEIDDYLELIDGLILTGGDFDIPPDMYGQKISSDRVIIKNKRTEFEIKLASKALEKGIPILGVCAGEQLLNVMFGGTLIQHIPDEIPDALEHEQPMPKAKPTHFIEVVEGSKLHRIVGAKRYMVNSTHHQAVKDVGEDMLISARADDGVVEAIEHREHKFCIGVEWHPEYLSCPEDERLIKSLIDHAREFKQAR
jgi:putative glutamine amidotransferase